MKSQHRLLKSWSRGLLVAMLGCSAVALAAPSALSRLEPGDMLASQAGPARASTIARILDRWQPVAAAQGQNIALWRDMMSIQMSQVDETTLSKLDALDPGYNQKGVSRQSTETYQALIAMLGGAVGEGAISKPEAREQLKILGSVFVDNVYTPVPPCRIVDTRNVGGPIAAGATRNFYGYSDTSGYDFSASQGGIAGAIGTVCPRVYFNPAAGTGSDANVPTAAMLTITVVNQGGPGNLIAWSGVGTVPNASALNYGTFATVGAVANTTVVPYNVGRGTTSRDFAIKVNAGTSADVVVDVVGYFTPPFGTALSCLETANTNVACGAGGFCQQTPTGCPAGYSQTSVNCDTDLFTTLNAGFNSGQCFWWAQGGADTGHASTHCCRIDGR